MEALVFHKFRNICIKTILYFVFWYIGTVGEKAMQTVSII